LIGYQKIANRTFIHRRALLEILPAAKRISEGCLPEIICTLFRVEFTPRAQARKLEAKIIKLFLPATWLRGYNWRFGGGKHQLLRQVQSAIEKTRRQVGCIKFLRLYIPMKKQNTFIVVAAVTAAVIAAFWLLLAAPAFTGNEINMTRGVTSQSMINYQLHMIILWICVVIGIIVFSAMFISIVLHRKSKGHEAAQFTHSTKAEIIWTIIPVLILVAMAVPATTALVNMEVAPETDMTIKITGFQWRWKYQYMEDEIEFISSLHPDSNAARRLMSGTEPDTIENYLLEVDKPLVLPARTKIKFLITADDVIHSWWVPALGWKRDAVPGFINEAWTEIMEPGVYRGQCAELCGKDHGFMPIVLNVLPEDEYRAWARQQRQRMAHEEAEVDRLWSRAELMELGENVYAAQCATCHQADGRGLAPAFPALAGSKIANGPLNDNIALVLHGREGTAMQAWGTRLSETDIAAALTYMRNAFGNETGDVVQPQTIARIKNG
jgi:cytochrome c oxidase subunit 2